MALQTAARDICRGEKSGATTIQLLGRFQVMAGDGVIDVPPCSSRLVAFLALHEHDVDRNYAAGCLWLDKTESRAQANLRSCLWRLNQCGSAIVVSDSTRLGIAPGVRVDLIEFQRFARALIDPDASIDAASVDTELFCGELLPDWYDEFVEVRREQLRQLRLHALEALSRRVLGEGRHAMALDLALAAVAAEPLRESAHRLVISIHVSEGNLCEAKRQFGRLDRLLRSQLGVCPSDTTRLLVESAVDRAAPAV